MTPQFLSEKMCHHLTSLAPGFEGHWWWVKYGSGIELWCTEDFAYFWKEGNGSVLSYKEFKQEVIICPAWQVEDVLRNLHTILPVEKKIEIQWLPGGANPYAFVSEEICKLLRIKDQDTAYQKIEEYLWSVLK